MLREHLPECLRPGIDRPWDQPQRVRDDARGFIPPALHAFSDAGTDADREDPCNSLTINGSR